MASRKMVRSTFGRCYYCGALDNVTNDHFIPQSKGGRIVVPACTLCQWTKRDLMPLEFAEYMEGHAAVTPGASKRIREAVVTLLEKLND